MSDAVLNLPEPPPARPILRRYVIGIALAALVPFILWPPLLTHITSSDFLPHRFCYLANSKLIWLNVTSDLLIGLAYVTISATLAYLVRRARRDIPFSWMFLAFGLFIVACGGTHFMEVLTVWKPFYWLSGDVKVVTALASVTTAMLLPGLVPKTLDLLTAARVARQRKQDLEAANVRLLELEKMSAGLAARAAAGIATWELNLRSGELTWAGEAEAIFGRNPRQLSSMDRLLAVVHEDDRSRVQQALDEAIAARAGYDTEFRLVWPDGAVRWLIAKGRVYSDQAGVPQTMIGVNMDVSARKQSEAALQQAEKLAVAGRLAASVAHEINNPLASVTNLVYLIQTHSATVPQVREYANLAQAELTRVAHVVRQTLGFYREPAAAIPVRVADVLENVFALHGPQLRAKSIALEKQYRDHAAVTGHPGELRQLFSNLVTNAIEALPQGGRLRVRISGGSPQRPGVRVIVADNGVGIPPDQLRRVFEPFFTTKGERGTGLGLWVSHSIVDKHGGRIRVRSRFGRGRSGTVFQVFLPQEQAEMETVAG